MTLAVTIVSNKPACPPLPTTKSEPDSQPQLALIHKEVMAELVIMKREVTALKNSARLSEVTDIMLLNESADSSEVAQTNLSSREETEHLNQ